MTNWSQRQRAMIVVLACVMLAAASGICTGQTAAATSPNAATRPNGAADAFPPSSGADLTNLSLEDLMNVQVTSVSKQKQRIADAPAAVTVIDQEDIERSGMTSIPDLLRLVPGMDVGSLDASGWAIGARGWSWYFANKLEVDMDGRSVYSPQFAGVFWNAQDYVLDDLDRIEVIRGPGATIWGANAVNGVVNITTKSADETQGWLVSGLGGNQEQSGTVRYGGQIDADTYYRIYSKYSNFNPDVTASGANAFDGWNSAQSGFRIDHYGSAQNTLTLQGDAYNQDIHQVDSWVTEGPPYESDVNDSSHADGGNLLGRWTDVISDTSSLSVQAYYDRLDHHDLTLLYQQDTADIDFQHTFALGARQEIIWGGGYRFYVTRADGSSQIQFSPTNRDLNLLSGFVQDDLTVVPDRLHLYGGIKLEADTYTGLEEEPTVRLALTPNQRNTFWAAVSGATRIPSRYEEDSDLRFAAFPAGGTTALVEGFGNNSLTSEKLTAYEIGYRSEPSKALSLDVTGFFNQYQDIINNTPETPFLSGTPPILVMPEPMTNGFSADTWGGELQATWRVMDNWRLVGSYSYLTGYEVDNTGHAGPLTQNNPTQQVQLHSYYDITKDLQFNTSGYYYTSQDAGSVPPYCRLDANIDWHATEQLDIMIGGQNLLNPRHLETNLQQYVVESEVPRSYFAKFTYRF